MTGLLHSIDAGLFLFLNRDIANPVFDFLFPIITNGRFWIVPGIIAVIVFIRVERKKALIITGLALVTLAITDPLASQVIKPLIHRHRPCDPSFLVSGGHFLIGMKTSLSFPSSHSMNIFAQAMLFTYFYPRLWIWFFSFAGIIGFSRIYVGVHYPFDVAGGAILGITIALLVFISYRAVMATIDKRHRHGRDVPKYSPDILENRSADDQNAGTITQSGAKRREKQV